MRERGTVLQMEDRQAAAGRTKSSISDPYRKEGLLPLSQEAALSVQIHSRDFERLSATLKDKDNQAPSKPCRLGTTDMVRGLMSERGEHIVQLNE